MYEEKLLAIINKIAREQNYNNYQVHMEEISSGGANYTSKLFKVTVTEDGKEELYLFGKVACISENVRNTMDDWKIYITEDLLYTELAKIYETIEDENSVAEEHRLVFSKYYGGQPTLYEEILVLEDLTAKGWSSFDRFKRLDWAYASSAITELSKFHALSFAFSEKDPDEFEQLIDDIQIQFNGVTLAEFINSAVNVALERVNLMYKDALREYLKDFNNKMKMFYRPIGRPVIVHGDYRGSNLMHMIREDGTVDIKIVDLQTLQGASPVVDLLYFIFTGSDEQFRAQYYEKLLDHYYTELEAAMKRLHLDPEKIYSRNDFECDLKEKLPFGLIIAVFALPVVTVAVENAPKVNKDMELSSFSVEKTSDLYVERLNGVVNDFVKWGILK